LALLWRFCDLSRRTLWFGTTATSSSTIAERRRCGVG